MNCKFCNAEIEEDYKACPFCGKSLVEDEIVESQVKKTKRKGWKLALYICGAVIVLAALAVLLLTALGVEIKLPSNDIHNKNSYTLKDDKAVAKGDVVVAKIGDRELTNAQLQIYYKLQVQNYVSYYGDYLTYMGLDLKKPLSDQTCYDDKTLTWEQFFLQKALETWQNYQVLGLLAGEAGFTVSQDAQKELDGLAASLEEQAKEEKYENAEAMVKDLLGSACSVETYLNYIDLYTLAGEYYTSVYDGLNPSLGDIEAYFTENETVFSENKITKDSGLISSVRHILVQPEGGTKNETGGMTYSDAAWAACFTRAEQILDKWKNGEATEESFAELVKTYTADTASSTTGGLYENVSPNSSFVKEFRAWATDMARETGDTGIVQTEFGYHIMYFVSGEAHWINAARTNYLAERMTDFIDEAQSKWPMEVSYRKIGLSAAIKTAE